jgi:hypothetical protein
VPGRSSVYRALVRHGLVDPQKRKRRREDYRRWERGRSMALWQMDVMGRVQAMVVAVFHADPGSIEKVPHKGIARHNDSVSA